MRILRGVSSKFLPCGCLAGVYETYAGHVVVILDAKAPTCAVAAHQNGKPVPGSSSTDSHPPVHDFTDRRVSGD